MCAGAQEGGFWSYAAGVAYWITLEHDLPGGAHISVHTCTLPMNSGLSSSAAVCVLVRANSKNVPFGTCTDRKYPNFQDYFLGVAYLQYNYDVTSSHHPPPVH